MSVTAPRTRHLLALPLIALLATKGQAQSDADADFLDSQDELILFEDIPTIYAASKYEQKVTEAPSSISIITAEEIEAYGYRTLGELLQSVRGFYTTNDHNYTYAGVRGFGRPGDYNTRLLVLVDGHRVNESLYGAAGIGNDFLVDIDLMDRVEVIRGANSSLYGTSAFLGVINIITKRGRDFRDSEVSVDVSDNGTYGGRFTYGDRFSGGAELLVSGSFYESDGISSLYFPEFDDPTTNNGVAQDRDGTDHESLLAKFSYNNLELEAAYVSRLKVIPTASYATAFNSLEQTVDEKIFVGVRYIHDFDSTMSLTTQFEYVDAGYWGDYPYDYADPGDPPDITVYKDLGMGKSWTAEAVLSKRFDRHMLTVGTEYRSDYKLDQQGFDIFEVYLDDQRDAQSAAVYLEEAFTLTDSVRIVAGLRYDDYDSFGSEVAPRVALVYSLPDSLPGETILKISHGEAFRAPNAYELYFDDGGFTNKAALVLEPETISTNELILEHYINPNLIAILSYYRFEIENLIQQVTDPLDGLVVFANVGHTDARGISFALEGRWADRITGRISYATQTAEDARSGIRLTNSPRNMAKANMMVPLFNNRVTAGLETQYLSERRTWAGRYTDSSTLVNLTFTSKEFVPGLTVSASFYNLFDEQYGDPASEEHLQDILPQQGRTYRFNSSYRF